MAITINKKDGTKVVKIDGQVFDKQNASYSRKLKSYTVKEKPSVKLMSCSFEKNVQTFKVRVGATYVWLQEGKVLKDNLHEVKFVEPNRNYDKYDENWDRKSEFETKFKVAKKYLLSTDLAKLKWEDLESIMKGKANGFDATDLIREAIHARNEEEKAERLAKEEKKVESVA